jgi:stage V sporulation protein G
MEITEVKVFPIQEEKLKAFVSIVFDQCFMVNDIKIIQGRDGLFISMPSRKKKNGEFKDVAHPLNNETRRMIEDKVLGEYERILGERGERMPQVASSAPGDGESALTSGSEQMPPVSQIPPIPSMAPPIGGLAASPAASGAAPVAAEKTLEEVEEMHLRDSFWTVT